MQTAVRIDPQPPSAVSRKDSFAVGACVAGSKTAGVGATVASAVGNKVRTYNYAREHACARSSMCVHVHIHRYTDARAHWWW